MGFCVVVVVVVVQVTGLQISWKAILNIIVDEEDREGDKINWRFVHYMHIAPYSTYNMELLPNGKYTKYID